MDRITKKLEKKHLSKRILNIFLILLVTGFSSCSFSRFPESRRAKSGTVDLSDFPFKDGKIAEISGYWEYFPEKLIPPGNKETSPHFLYLPHTWNQSVVDESGSVLHLPKTGKATYRLKLNFGENPPERLMFRIHQEDSVFAFYLNGQLLYTNTRDNLNGKAMPRDYSPVYKSFSVPKGTSEILIQMANYAYPRGGIRSSLQIGPEEAVLAVKDSNSAREVFFFGAVLTMGLYFILLYLLNRSESSPLYLSITLFLVAWHATITGEGLLYQWDFHTWKAGTFGEYISMYLAVPFFVIFIQRLFSAEMSKTTAYSIAGVSSIFPVLVITTPIMIYTDTLIFFSGMVLVLIIYFHIVLIRAAWKKREGSKSILFGFLIFSIAAVNDILYSQRLIQTPYLSPIGFSIFFAIQGSLIARRYTHNLKVSQNMTEILEGKIQERTKELETEKAKSDNLLRNILPERIAKELLEDGFVSPREYLQVGIMFLDIVDFTKHTTKLSPEEVIWEIDTVYSGFDEISAKYNIEKLKTMGDAYIGISGLNENSMDHLIKLPLAAMEMRTFLHERNKKRPERVAPWSMRIGLHVGNVVGGVVGRQKFAFDLWGDPMNTASRVEKHSMADRINCSEDIAFYLKSFFVLTEREETEVKGKGKMKMYFLEQILPELSENGEGKTPNAVFWESLTYMSELGYGPSSLAL